MDQNKLPPSQGLGRIMKRMWQIMRHSKRVLIFAAICMVRLARMRFGGQGTHPGCCVLLSVA